MCAVLCRYTAGKEVDSCRTTAEVLICVLCCAGIQLVKKLIATEPLQKFGAKLYEKHFPGCNSLRFDSTEYWRCYIRHLTLTSYHPAGTCAMGANSVVDSYLR